MNLKNLDLKLVARVTKSGDILLKVQDDQVADKLVVALDAAIGRMARIKKPSRTSTVLILDLAEWHSANDVEAAVVNVVPELLERRYQLELTQVEIGLGALMTNFRPQSGCQSLEGWTSTGADAESSCWRLRPGRATAVRRAATLLAI